MKCTKCQKKVHSSEIYTDYYYCKVCDRSYSLREDEGMTKDNPDDHANSTDIYKVLRENEDKLIDNLLNGKDYCACCEHPELLHMMQPRIQELEKNWQLETNRIDYAITKIDELEKQVHKLSKKTCIDLDIIACIDYRLHELDNKVKELDEKLAKKLDAKTDI